MAVAFAGFLDHLHLQVQRHQRLHNSVVKFPRHPSSFFASCATPQVVLQRSRKDRGTQPVCKFSDGNKSLRMDSALQRIPKEQSDFPLASEHYRYTDKGTKTFREPVFSQVVLAIGDRYSR